MAFGPPAGPWGDGEQTDRAAPPFPSPNGDHEETPDTGYADEPSDELIVRLRALRAEAQDLREALNAVRKGEAPLGRFGAYIKLTCKQMDELIDGLQDRDDCVRHIHNSWEQLRTCQLMQDPAATVAPQTQLQLLSILDGQLRKIIFWASYRSIPKRLNDWLASMQPGYALPFHAVFADEVPDAEDRQQILNLLAWSPNDIKGGVIDPANGLVYRYSRSLRGRLLSLLAVIAAIVVATLIVLTAGRMPPLNIAAADLDVLLVGWGAVLAGIGVHIAVGTAKRMRARDTHPAVLPVSRFMLLVNARLGEILLKVAIALIGFFGLVYTTSMPDETAINAFLLNAFLVGYSLDSIVELFSAGIDQRATAFRASLASRGEGRAGV